MRYSYPTIQKCPTDGLMEEGKAAVVSHTLYFYSSDTRLYHPIQPEMRPAAIRSIQAVHEAPLE